MAQPRRRGNPWGVARVFGYLSLVLSLAAALMARAVYARVGEAVLQAGRDLDGVHDFTNSPKSILVNGALMNVATANVALTPAEVLDRYEAMCKTQPQFLVRGLADIPAGLKAKLESKGWASRLPTGIIRKETPHEGALTCFTDEHPQTLAALPDRIKAYNASGDISQFGHFRYVYVKATPQGSHVRTVWTDSPVYPARMFPSSGDAEGFDSDIFPRPPNGRRILSAATSQVPYGMYVYEVNGTQDETRAFYDREMAARGWRVVKSGDGVAYEKLGGVVYSAFGVRGGHTYVTMTATGRSDTPLVAEVSAGP